MNNYRFAGLIVLNLLFASTASQALSEQSSYNYWDRLSLGASLGYLSGTSKEFVYDEFTGRKISELNWEISGAAILRGEANYHLFQWLDLNGRGWVTLSQSSGVMDDYDWLNPGQALWTHWSHHEDTSFRQGNEFDLNLRSWLIQKPTYQLAGMAGYQRTLFSFHARGGCFIYDNGENVGCFTPGKSTIGYKQTYETPYIGLAGKYLHHAFEFNGILKFSNWVNAKDVDQHYLRNLTFNERGNQFKYYNAVLNAGYFVKSHIKLFAEGSISYIPNHIAETEIIDSSSGERAYSPNGSAGLGNRNYIIALGVQYVGEELFNETAHSK